MLKGGKYLSSVGSGGGSCEQHIGSVTDTLANRAVEVGAATMPALCSALLMDELRCVSHTNMYSRLLPLQWGWTPPRRALGEW